MVGIVRDVDGVTRNEIVSGTAEKLIVALLTGDIVIAALAVDDVVAASASHPHKSCPRRCPPDWFPRKTPRTLCFRCALPGRAARRDRTNRSSAPASWRLQ